MARERLVDEPVTLATAEEVSGWLKTADSAVELVGSDSKRDLRLEPRNPNRARLQFIGAGILEHFATDQVVRVLGGTPIQQLLQDLAKTGQTIPMPDPRSLGLAPAGFPGLLAGTISMDMPHAFAGSHGSWRDWVLGMTVVLSDGTTIKTGSNAVKNVAGYDLHKLFIGARGTLGVITEVVLRTYPLKAFESFQCHYRADQSAAVRMLSSERSSLCEWIQRVRRSNWATACEQARAYDLFADYESSTLWAKLPDGRELPRYPHDWVLRSGCGPQNVEISNPAQRDYMLRLKQKFDPANRLNPGEFGFL